MCVRNKKCCEDKPSGTFGRILVAVDNSLQATWAIQLASELAEANRARLAVLHVYPMPLYVLDVAMIGEQLQAGAEANARAILNEQCALASTACKCEQILRTGYAVDEILDAAQEWKADLIVLGTHGRGAMGKLILGSTADGVIRAAPCPVLSVGSAPAVAKRCTSAESKAKSSQASSHPAASVKDACSKNLEVAPS